MKHTFQLTDSQLALLQAILHEADCATESLSLAEILNVAHDEETGEFRTAFTEELDRRFRTLLVAFNVGTIPPALD